MAKKMITEYGMSRLGPVHFREKEELSFWNWDLGSKNNFSEKTFENIDQELERLIQEAYTRASNIIVKNKGILDKIARELIEKEVIEKEELEKLLEN